MFGSPNVLAATRLVRSASWQPTGYIICSSRTFRLTIHADGCYWRAERMRQILTLSSASRKDICAWRSSTNRRTCMIQGPWPGGMGYHVAPIIDGVDSAGKSVQWVDGPRPTGPNTVLTQSAVAGHHQRNRNDIQRSQFNPAKPLHHRGQISLQMMALGRSAHREISTGCCQMGNMLIQMPLWQSHVATKRLLPSLFVPAPHSLRHEDGPIGCPASAKPTGPSVPTLPP